MVVRVVAVPELLTVDLTVVRPVDVEEDDDRAPEDCLTVDVPEEERAPEG